MEMFIKCDRCGALVETTNEILGGMSVKCAPCAVTTKVSSNDVLVVRDGCETTVLCPDCMERLKEWLASEPKEPQEAADSVERLANDMVRAVEEMQASGIRVRFACGYFGHVGAHCLNGGVCPAYGDGYGGDSSCNKAMFDDVRRRCDELGIDLGGEADEE